jgi:hypothetical protein
MARRADVLLDELVLAEAQRITWFGVLVAFGGWFRPFQIRHFHEDTTAEVKALTLDQIDYRLRKLAARGELEKKPGEKLYRIPPRDDPHDIDTDAN